MNPSSELSQVHQQFLSELNNTAQGDTKKVVSMYAIGKSIGLDDQTAKRTAEDLIGMGILEIKTLSGGICLTETGLSEVNQMAGSHGQSGQISGLGDSLILTSQSRQSIITVLEDIKTESGKLGLDFEALKELMADLKTIESQLESPKPKTKIFQHCFQSIKQNLEKKTKAQSMAAIDCLLEI